MIRVTTYQLRRLVCVRVEHVPSGVAVEACRRQGRADPLLAPIVAELRGEAVAMLAARRQIEGERRAA